jgi:SNF2 family DNA or RNA helicase
MFMSGYVSLEQFVQQLKPVPIDLIKYAAELKTELMPHQQRVVDKIKKNNLLVVHGTGTGKTLSSIAAGVELNQPVQVIAPTSLVGNYEKEVKKHVEGDLPVKVVSVGKAVNRKLNPDPGLVVVDEAHGFRNADTARGQYLSNRNILNKNHRVMLLTGTPAYNRISDIAPLLNTVHGKEVVPSEPSMFDKEYIDVKKVSPGLLNSFMGIKPGEKQYLKNTEKLKRLLNKYVDFHESVSSEFPERVDEEITVPLSQSQYDVYRYLENTMPFWAKRKIRDNLPPSKAETTTLNAWMQGVRQVSLSEIPYRYNMTPEEAAERSTKLSRAVAELKDQYDKDPNFRAFVYSNYLTAGLLPMAAALRKHGIPSAVFHGGLTQEQRNELVKKYNSGEIKVLLGSAAASEGLDLKGTKIVQVLEPHFNNSRIDQAVARGIRYKSHAHLPPEERQVRVQRFISQIPPSIWDYLRKRPYSADEHIRQRAQDKDELVESLKNLLREAT